MLIMTVSLSGLLYSKFSIADWNFSNSFNTLMITFSYFLFKIMIEDSKANVM
jgi:hypothetical protein